MEKNSLVEHKSSIGWLNECFGVEVAHFMLLRLKHWMVGAECVAAVCLIEPYWSESCRQGIDQDPRGIIAWLRLLTDCSSD